MSRDQQGVYCAAPEKNRREQLGDARRLGGLERYHSETRLCLIDSENDGKFDKAFVVGTLDESDWHISDIAPIDYDQHRHIDMGPDWHLTVYYYPLGKPGGQLNTLLILDGRRVNLASFTLGGKGHKAEFRFNAQRAPYHLAMGGASVFFTAGPDGKMTMRYERNFDHMPLDYKLARHIEYIYVYY